MYSKMQKQNKANKYIKIGYPLTRLGLKRKRFRRVIKSKLECNIYAVFNYKISCSKKITNNLGEFNL